MAKPRVLFLKEQGIRFFGSRIEDDVDPVAPPDGADIGAWLDANGKGIRLAVSSATDHFDRDMIGKLPDLERIVVFGTGMDGLDLEAAADRGIVVTNAAGLNSGDVADHAVGMMFAAHRRLVEGDAVVREGRWTNTMQMTIPLVRSLSASRFGIAGLGHIGRDIAERVSPLSPHVAWWGPHPKEAKWPMRATLLELARDSDILFVAVKADDSTRGLIDEAVIEALGPEGLLVNVARGFVVDEEALVAALRDGRLGQAALDVFDPEPTTPERWSDLPNVLLSPHRAGATREALVGLVDHAVESIRAFFAAESPNDQVAS